MDFGSLVESMIYGISISKQPGEYSSSKHIVSIDIEDNYKNRWSLTATGVSDLCIKSLCIQNIIHEVYLFEGVSSDCDDVRNKIHFLLDAGDQSNKNDWVWKLVEQFVTSISAGQACLLEIEPVCGAYILMIAESISLKMISR